VVLFGFAIVYAVLKAIAGPGLSALFRPSALGPIAVDAAILSVRSFALDLIIKWHDIFGFKAEIPSAPIVQYLVWIEAAAGLALIAMTTFSLGRWFKRNFVPH
jgi:hypothetical protein